MPKSRNSLFCFLFLSTLLIGLFVWMTSSFILVVVIGAIMAMLLMPIHRKLSQKAFSMKMSALIVTLLLMLVILAPLAFFSIRAIDQGVEIASDFTKSDKISYQVFSKAISKWSILNSLIGDETAVENAIKNTFVSGSRNLSLWLLSVLGKLPSLTIQLFLALITCYFSLIQGTQFVKWMLSKIPIDNDVKKRLRVSFETTGVSVVYSVLAASFTQSTILLLGFLFLKVPGAFFAAGATFIFSMIPVLGSTPVWIAGAIYLYFNSTLTSVIIMIAVGLVTGIADNVVRPMILKGRDNMNTLLSLVAIFGGIEVFGILGVLIGPIIAALVVTVLEIWPDVGRRAGIEFEFD